MNTIVLSSDQVRPAVPAEAPPAARLREVVCDGLWPRRRRRHKTILLIEDEPLNRQVIARYLGLLGYRVCQAERGDEGLAAALRNEPDLILLDRQLPGLKGIDLVSRLREAGRTTPVVMMSAYEILPGERKQAQALKVRGFIRKPFAFRHLRAVVHFGLGRPRLGSRRAKMFFREPQFSLASRNLARKIFESVFREGLDMGGHVHFHVKGHSDHLILLCSRKYLGKVVAKSEECRSGECIPWDRSSFHRYNQDEVIQALNQEINQVRIDAADYQMSWPTLADFICWLELSYR